MDAKRLQFRRELAEGFNSDADRELLRHIDQQQAEIERLKGDNRRLHVICDERQARAMDYLKAYERLEREIGWLNSVSVYEPYKLTISVAISEAQRIKDGTQEE